jgi:tRNA uridine 5-carboxymethylaminomethyl modification enzyme
MTNKKEIYDVIVIGGGHAGYESAAAAARIGAKTLLITMNMDHIAQMSCNPAIGGIAKGQVVREIDALGGIMGMVSDATAIQFRILNRRKGPAVWSPRAQCDKMTFQRAIKRELEIMPNLDIKQGEVMSFVLGKDIIQGVKTNFGDEFICAAVVLSPGTFLSGKLHYGFANFAGGRAGDFSSDALPEALKNQLGLELARLKTGTPPRVLSKTIDFSKTERQEAEDVPGIFSFFGSGNIYPRATKQNLPCYTVRSTKKTADIVLQNIDRSPLYSGKISGVGTRYCPSFEDKVIKFPHHETHLLFLEPEGEFTEEYYLNGISTSLPVDVQVRMLHSIPALANAVISRYAYAIEYDFVLPRQMMRTLQLKRWTNLLTAGQINGTSGYEEAGGQGVVAGMNAAKIAAGDPPIELSRESSYIGVMIDDLVTKDITEPYRLFTSRAEYRLSIRQDNADLRLCHFGHKNKLLPKDKFHEFTKYEHKLQKVQETIINSPILRSKIIKAGGLIEKLPKDFPFEELGIGADTLSKRVLEQIVIGLHYDGYVEIEKRECDRLKKMETAKISPDFDYSIIKGLRNEARAKLETIRPTTLAQASRIDGVTAAQLALIHIYLKRKK